MLGHFSKALPNVGGLVVDLLWLFGGSMTVLAGSTEVDPIGGATGAGLLIGSAAAPTS
jgi:hypothetical protein